MAFDGLGGAIVLDLLATHEHGNVVGDRDACSDRESSVGYTADEVEGGVGREGRD